MGQQRGCFGPTKSVFCSGRCAVPENLRTSANPVKCKIERRWPNGSAAEFSSQALALREGRSVPNQRLCSPLAWPRKSQCLG
jgi:hypothetical protein